MGDIWWAVEGRVDTVADVSPDHRAVVGFGVLLNYVAELTEQRARLDFLDCQLQTFPSGFDNTDGVGVGLRAVAYIVCLVQIAVVALVVERYVQVDNVAIQQDTLVGNTVADDLVDRGTDGLGEVVVVERRRVGLATMSACSAPLVMLTASIKARLHDSTHVALDTLLVHDPVDLIGGDARSDSRRRNVENLSCQPADLAHTLLRLLVQDIDLVPVCKRSAALGNTTFGIVRVRDRFGDLASGAKGVYGSQAAGEREVREGVVVTGLWIWFRYDSRWYI